MKVVKATGLVPVKAISRAARQGVFGVSPQAARDGVKAGTLKLVDVPDEIETIEVAGPDTVAVAEPVDHVPPANEIVIPEDWRTSVPLVRFNLAKKISGKAPELSAEDEEAGKTKTDVADAIIQTEIQRRAAAAT